VPVTAKLSRKLYEKLGDDVANELVEWFNMVDATYRLDLKQVNELNFARFDAKLEQRVAELRALVDQRFAEFETKLTNRLFVFWVAQAATTVGLVFGVVKMLGS
jgi:hypothetical protein